MKAKRSVKNLRINKQTVSNLNLDRINGVKGGATHTLPPVCNTQTNCETNCECTEFYSCYLSCTNCPVC